MRRYGDCDEPGPGDAHCTNQYLHDYSCYDAGQDVSWNDRQYFEHHCEECPDDGLVNEGD